MNNEGLHMHPAITVEAMGASVSREGMNISVSNTPPSATAAVPGSMENSGTTGSLMGSTRRTSRVWRYFGMVDNCHYICRLCSFVGAYTNTTNMRKHIQHHHPERFQDILDHTRPTTRPFYSSAVVGMRPPLQQFPPQAHQQHHHHLHSYPSTAAAAAAAAAAALGYPHNMGTTKRTILPKPEVAHVQSHSSSNSEHLHHPVVSIHHQPSLNDHLPSIPTTSFTSPSSQSCSMPHLSSIPSAASISTDTMSAYSCSVAQSVITSARSSTPHLNMPSVTACELNQEESEIVTQLLPPLSTEGSNDSEIGVRGLTGGDDRGSSEYSQNEEETGVTASPEQFMAEGSEREPTPAPVAPTPPKPESYQLRHNNHLTIVLDALARDEAFMDVTLTAQGRSLKAHKSVLSAVSPYFRSVLRENPCQHPIIIMPRDVRFEELFSIVNYIYKGEMTVAAEDLTSLLKTAEILQVSGLAPSDSTATVNPHTSLAGGGNLRSSSSSSSSSSNVLSASKASKTVKDTNQGISHPQARSKSPDGMINPSDFMDMDMTYVKEEVQSGGEEDEDDTATSETSAPAPAEASPKSGEMQQNEPISFPSINSPHQEQTSTPNGSSQDLSSSHVKTENEEDPLSVMGSSKSCNENPLPFVCPYCQEHHRGIENLATHLRLNHPTKPNFTCGCGRVFTRNMHHQAHVKVCSSSL